ncbi:MAG TPA: hypothetical protein VFW09_13195 [Solirubrobacteraceae bacterium]|nr:hypothetical protein [Solirubrobacteraceae bacterium]
MVCAPGVHRGGGTAQILNLLADIREQTGIAHIFISHDLAVVRQITEQALVKQHPTGG